MTIVRIAAHSLLRAGAIALLVVVYDVAYDEVLPPTAGDADIGKGLLAFLLIAGVSLMWGLFDGLRLPPLVWAVAWIVAGTVVAVGWELILIDGSLSDVEVSSVVFTAQLVIVPAVFAAGLAWAFGGRSRETQPAH